VTWGLYLSIFFFYFTALIIPLTEDYDSCTYGHENKVFYYYAIYAIASSVIEVIFCIYLERVIDDKEILEFNKFHVWKIVAG
jgi:hypothetical protein